MAIAWDTWATGDKKQLHIVENDFCRRYSGESKILTQKRAHTSFGIAISQS